MPSSCRPPPSFGALSFAPHMEASVPQLPWPMPPVGANSHLMPETGEKVVLVDETGRPVGTEFKSRVHSSDTPLHLAFSVFLFDPQGRMLIQRRALHKMTWPGVWSNACCGHPLPGESLPRAVDRRLAQELALAGTRTMLALPRFRYRARWGDLWENELCPVFVGICREEPVPNGSEIADLAWVEWGDFAAACRSPRVDASVSFSPWSVWEGRLLDESGVVVELLNASGASSGGG